MRGEIECKAPGLTPLRRRALDRLRTWPAHEFLHVKRDWNQSADRLANTALHQQEGTVVTSEADHDDLVVLNRLQKLLLPKDEGSVVRMAATTRSRTRSKNSAEVLQLDVVQRIRTDRVLRAQNEEKWIVNLRAYLSGDLESLDAGACGKIAGDYDVDEGGLLLYCSRPTSTLTNREADRVDFDEDVRSSKNTRYGRTRREFLVFWKGYDEPSWVDEIDLNCGALLRDFDRGRTDRNRFEEMQSHEE
ncbi:hypothetical protein PPTG_19992 [Phytophthora nicotianae INRA-310]|uniref:Chromo domain-containing protein n=1 Tax=Phytophthora nicotianae (strain INRA-310) TaxID=761204 RepID=W2PCI2_PHYN3|nr:hypothetical protein PPTG_19992 [Phytophthora nicotianae INRA-310]ETM97719.1 hypothetical protein PPTG_19992 [Phytophthora nicotianae INRA-310]